MVAAVLHLYEGTHPTFEAVDEVGGRLRHGHDVVDRDLVLGGEAERCARQHVAVRAPGLRADLLLVAQYQRDLGHIGKGFRLGLRRAARDHDAHRGTLALEPANGLARLAHRLRRHRAGVDDDRLDHACRLCLAADHFRLIGVEPAAEGDDVDAHPVAASANSAGSNLPSYSYATGPVINT